jgi:adenylate cyclase
MKDFSAAHDGLTSLAVLPFANLSGGEEQAYLSEGITEEIIHALSIVEGLKVIARSSSFLFKEARPDLRAIGEQLGVNLILEGSVRQHGQHIRISIRLIRVADSSTLWAQSYDRRMGDLFALQDEISLLVAEQIRGRFGHLEIQPSLIKAPTQNLEAYNLYLKGRYQQLKWTPEAIQEAIGLYQESLALDPKFALPCFSLGVCYGILGSWGFWDKKEAGQRAFGYLDEGFKLEKNTPLGWVSRAGVHFWLNWDVKAALADLRKLQAYHHSMAAVPEALAEVYTVLGQLNEAEQEARLAITLDPLSAPYHYTLAHIQYLKKDFTEALGSLDTALSLNPEWQIAKELKAACFIRMGNLSPLSDYLEKEEGLRSLAPLILRLFQAIHAPSSAKKEAPPSLSHTVGKLPWMLYLAAHLGHETQALQALIREVKARHAACLHFMVDPFFAILHSLPQYQQLVQTTFPPISSLPAPPPKASKAPFTSQEVVQELERLSKLQQSEQPYLDPNLNLKALAAQLDLHPNKLSWLINEGLGKNFNEYINAFRLQAFQEKALAPEFAHLSLLGIAYECGFNSKSTFNAFFKKETGLSPRAWLKAQSQQ